MLSNDQWCIKKIKNLEPAVKKVSDIYRPLKNRKLNTDFLKCLFHTWRNIYGSCSVRGAQVDTEKGGGGQGVEWTRGGGFISSHWINSPE